LTPLFFPPAEAESGISAPHPGFQAPDFSLLTPDDETLSLSDYRGQPVLVFLWASWCSVCKATMPGLQAVYSDYQALGFEILAVNTTFQDTLSAALNYFQSQGYTYPILLDRDGAVSDAYELHALPTAILVRPDGVVESVVIGSSLSEGSLRAAINDLLSDQE
jgi:peroxiredoxin